MAKYPNPLTAVVLAAACTILAVTPSAAQFSWTHVYPSGSPPSPRGTSSVYVKAARDTFGTMYIWGGHNGSQALNDMYALSLRPGQERWTAISQGGTLPNPRSGHTLIYDQTGNRILLFGGDLGGYNTQGDFWEFNLSTLRWSHIDTVGYVSPPHRHSGQGAYYPDTRTFYLFGGVAYRYPMGWYWHDTWRLDPSSGTWQQLTPNGNYIPRATGAGIVDEANNRMVVFGGMTSGGWFNEAWTIGPLDQSNMVIKQLSPAGTPPPRLRNTVAIYDSLRQSMIVFSGQDDGMGYHNNVWELGLAPGSETWQERYPSGTVPPSMSATTAVLDEPNGRMIVFGGNTGSGLINDVYALGGLASGTYSPSPANSTLETRVLSVHPNPSTREFTFDYNLSKPSAVHLRIFDVTGRLVRNMGEESANAGSNHLVWDGKAEGRTPCPSGIYFYEWTGDGQTIKGKVIITR